MSDPKNRPNTAEELESRELSFKRIIAKETPLVFSDNFAIKQQEGMFLLYFFQNQHPLAFTQEDLDKIEEIETQCVARVIMTPGQLKKTLDALQAVFDGFLAKVAEMTQADRQDDN